MFAAECLEYLSVTCVGWSRCIFSHIYQGCDAEVWSVSSEYEEFEGLIQDQQSGGTHIVEGLLPAQHPRQAAPASAAHLLYVRLLLVSSRSLVFPGGCFQFCFVPRVSRGQTTLAALRQLSLCWVLQRDAVLKEVERTQLSS